MRKSALFLAALLVASVPSIADAKKHKAAKDPNANSRAFVAEGLRQILVPGQSIIEPAKPAKKKRMGKKKK